MHPAPGPPVPVPGRQQPGLPGVPLDRVHHGGDEPRALGAGLDLKEPPAGVPDAAGRRRRVGPADGWW